MATTVSDIATGVFSQVFNNTSTAWGGGGSLTATYQQTTATNPFQQAYTPTHGTVGFGCFPGQEDQEKKTLKERVVALESINKSLETELAMLVERIQAFREELQYTQGELLKENEHSLDLKQKAEQTIEERAKELKPDELEQVVHGLWRLLRGKTATRGFGFAYNYHVRAS